jgi:hypothetical protein
MIRARVIGRENRRGRRFVGGEGTKTLVKCEIFFPLASSKVLIVGDRTQLAASRGQKFVEFRNANKPLPEQYGLSSTPPIRCLGLLQKNGTLDTRRIIDTGYRAAILQNSTFRFHLGSAERRSDDWDRWWTCTGESSSGSGSIAHVANLIVVTEPTLFPYYLQACLQALEVTFGPALRAYANCCLKHVTLSSIK